MQLLLLERWKDKLCCLPAFPWKHQSLQLNHLLPFVAVCMNNSGIEKNNAINKAPEANQLKSLSTNFPLPASSPHHGVEFFKEFLITNKLIKAAKFFIPWLLRERKHKNRKRIEEGNCKKLNLVCLWLAFQIYCNGNGSEISIWFIKAIR